MSGLISGLLSSPWAWLALAAVAGGIYWQIRRSGAKAERERQARERQKARDIADRVDNDVGALPPELVKKDLKSWSPER
jgi:hypothetical protein